MKTRMFLPIVVLAAFAAPAALQAGSLTILRFEADWCGPCRQMAPVFESVVKGYPGVAFETVNVDRQSALADRYGVASLPTVVALRDGKEVGRVTGFQNRNKLNRFVKRLR